MSEKERDSIEGESGKIDPVWEKGYGGWRIRFKGVDRSAGKLQHITGEPRLRDLMSESDWEPGEEGEIVSDWREGEDEPFERTKKGFYFQKGLGDAVEEYEEADIYGAIIPHGKTFYEKSTGEYRSEKATINTLYKKILKCFVCREPAKFIVHNEETYAVCGKCLGRLKNTMAKGRYVGEEIEDILRRLVEIYETRLRNLPKQYYPPPDGYSYRHRWPG